MSAPGLERWRGRWAVVTGASSGLGQALAHGLGSAGMHLVLCGRDPQRLQETALAIEQQSKVQCRIARLDLSHPDACEQLLAECEPLDVRVLVAAAGFGSSGPLLDQPLREQLEQVQVNCASVLHLAHAFGRCFRAQGDGALLLFSSIVAFQGVPGSTTYAASKAFVQCLAEGLAAELAGSGVGVLAAAPGPVATRFGARAGLGMAGAAEPEALVDPLLRALGRSGTVRPGALSKLLGYSLAMLPRPLRVRLMQRIMGGMIAAGRPAGVQS
jgi:short-subunit dehydrogenase